MNAAALAAPAPGLQRWLSDLLYTRRGLLLLALLAPPLLWFGVVYLGALFALLANAFFGLDDFTGQVVREFTLKNFVELTTPANLDVARRSITMAIAVTLACTAIAFPLAYYMARHASGAGKALLYIAVMLPLWSSYLVRLYAWKLLLAKEGAISWLAAATHTTGLIDLEASGDLGAGPAMTFAKVILPLALPGIAAGSIFTFSLTLGDYIIPQVIGDSTMYIGQVVYKQQGVAGNIPFAAAFSLVPIVVIGIYLWLAKRAGAFDAL
jgi:putative spermidine/putrescine transport system permease protein